MSNPVEKCSNCKFARKAHDPGRYICRREINPGKSSQDFGWFTLTYGEWWCGEWKPGNDSVASIYADWLEEQGHKDAATKLRTFDQ